MRGLNRLAAGLAALFFAASPCVAAEWPAPWVELAADGTLSVRTTVAPGAACPAVSADGAAVATALRGAPDGKFPLQLCEARVPAATGRLLVGGAGVPTLPATVRRIVVIGDTGCRLEGRAI